MKRLLSVTGFTALLTLLRMVAGFVIAKVVAIYTGPTGMAMLGQIQSIVGILNGIINAPVGTGVVRYTAENIDDGFESCAPWWKASLYWCVILLILIVPIGCLLSGTLSYWLFDDKGYYWLIILACIVLPFSAINTLITSIINGQQQYKRYVILGMISTLISTIIMITLIFTLNLKGALIAAVINTSISGIILLLSSLNQPWLRIKYWWGVTELEHKKKLGGYTLMTITSAISLPIALIFIRNMLVQQVGWDSAGQWQAVWKISEVYLSIITLSLSTYYLPKLSKINNVVNIKSEIIKTTLVALPVVILAAGIVYLLRDVAISVLFTKDFYNAREFFAIQLLGDVVKIISWIFAYPMLSRGNVKIFVISELLFSFIFVLLAFVFIPIFGVHGANYAYLLNYILYFLFVFLFYFRNMR
ncbi:O-antigen translocase [Photobacterium phosphoreum]|uniref:O-antigen translocase n=1 Tax=Photobacterium phosphoreum TaxID=659 RepID=UPI001E5EFD44|nr:O-antigen translocase [Photobacterium phosphoreum]MCD9475609.1 oligosaccharide flippase family protein [Photobacterium phosphoreum]MCF2177609.1 oligosaccharide flippase family protein [Photobacterium phosphoreum]